MGGEKLWGTLILSLVTLNPSLFTPFASALFRLFDVNPEAEPLPRLLPPDDRTRPPAPL